jgi:hypothetical protein
MRSSLTSIPHVSAPPSSASRAGPSPPCRAARLRAGPVEQRSCACCAHRHPASCRAAPATGPSTAQHVRVGLLPCCAMTGPPTDTADTEAAALEAAAAAAAPPSDVQPQELAVRLVKEKDSAAATERQAAYDAALTRLAQAEEEAANASKARSRHHPTTLHSRGVLYGRVGLSWRRSG